MTHIAEEKLDRSAAIAQLTAPGQPYEIVEQMIGGVKQRVFASAPATFRDFFDLNCSDAIQYVYEDERYTYEDTYQRAARVAHALINDYGIGKGDRVAIAMRNYPEWAVAFEAITSIGAVAVAMNALWESEEMAFGLAHSGSRLIFADQERLQRLAKIETLIDVISVRAENSNVKSIENLVAASDVSGMPFVDIDADDNATILYTSGSTGKPKGAVSTYRNIMTAILSYELENMISMVMNRITPRPMPYQMAMLLGVPLFHVAGLHSVLLGSYREQRKIVAMYKRDSDKAAGLIEAEQISVFAGPATMTGDLLEVGKRTDRDLSTLRVVGGGGSPRSPQQVRGIKETFSKASTSQAWGMTETNGLGTMISGDDYVERSTCSGRCAPVLDIKVVDDAGVELSANQPGEIWVRGPTVIREYWDNDEANRSSFVDGWFRSGDIAYLDEEGYLYIVDRLKDLIIRGGENIGCGEVEAGLMEHPAVLEAAVYGMPDERLGEEIGSTIYCSEQIDEDELRAFLQQHLARFKIPVYIRVSNDHLPRTGSGKIKKLDLRQQHIDLLADS